jgi:hypothetical protein
MEGKPRAAHDQAVEAIIVILSLINAISVPRSHGMRTLAVCRVMHIRSRTGTNSTGYPKIGRFRHGLLGYLSDL